MPTALQRNQDRRNYKYKATTATLKRGSEMEEKSKWEEEPVVLNCCGWRGGLFSLQFLQKHVAMLTQF